MDEVQESSVTGGEAPTADVSVESSAPASPSSGEIGGEVTPVSTEVAETVPSDPAGVSEEPYELPDVEELKQNIDQPHVKALINLREQYDAVKEAQKPFNQLTERYGTVEDVQRNLSLVDGLFETADGKFTTAPFIDSLKEMSPQTVWQLAEDLFSTQVVAANGQPVQIASALLQQLGLDPTRLQMYKDFDNGKFANPTAVSSEVLESIDPAYHNAFNALDPAIQSRWEMYDEDEKVAHLNTQQRLLERDAKDAERDQFYQNAQQEKAQQARQELETAQWEAVGTIRNEAYSYIQNQLTEQWKPTGDPKQNAAAVTSVMGTCAALIDPTLRGLFAENLTQAGISVDFQALDAAVAKIETKAAEAVALTKAGELERAKRVTVEVNGAKQKVTTLLSHVALSLAGARGGTIDAARQTTNGAIAQAQAARPAINGAAASISGTNGAPKYNGGPVDPSTWLDIAARSVRPAQ